VSGASSKPIKPRLPGPQTAQFFSYPQAVYVIKTETP